ncbi:hypothetical protein QJQ45_024952 [Haematococcus lacustris]|nr:hypothetical protein QJQ45_024952 [Haematococcus lacustris]
MFSLNVLHAEHPCLEGIPVPMRMAALKKIFAKNKFSRTMEKLLFAKALKRYGANADDAGSGNAEAEDDEAEVNELSASGRVEPDADCAPPAPPALSLKPLSQLQQDIVDDPARAKVIQAVAGSGKTEVLVQNALKAAREGTNVLFVTKVHSVTFEIMKRLKAHLKIAEFAESGNHYYTRLGSGAVIEVANYDAMVNTQLLHPKLGLRVWLQQFGDAYSRKAERLCELVRSGEVTQLMMQFPKGTPAGMVVVDEMQAPRSSQAATPAGASEPGPSNPPPAKRSKRTEAEQAAEPSQLTKGKGKAQGKAQGKAAKAKPAPQPGRWLDRDCNAALNMQRIGESRWRPLELCWWLKQAALPAKGKEYPELGCKRLRDKPPKAQQQQPVAQ